MACSGVEGGERRTGLAKMSWTELWTVGLITRLQHVRRELSAADNVFSMSA